MIITMLWFFIDIVLFVGIGLGILYLFLKYSGGKKSYSEHLFENAFHALQDLEDYYDSFPDAEREKALKVLKGIAVELGALDREVKKK